MLRYRFALPNGMLHSPHASSILMFYFICTYIFALPCFMLIMKLLQG
ncbi:MAG: hypothetical protein NZ455_00050 [Bacteroidia bacterium]|nr:hypothetical protein [Bacteroidia bacterium]MDW8346623.1 hypothetical protein [Bacteroidia bacterium]